MQRMNCARQSPRSASKPRTLTRLIYRSRREGALLRSSRACIAPSICLSNCSRWRGMRRSPPVPAEMPLSELDSAVKEVVADLLPEAADRDIDLGFALFESLTVRSEPVMLAAI